MGAVVALNQQEPDAVVLARAAEVLRAGGVLVVPTDSVYGLACMATPGNAAHARIFQIKRRDRAQTLPWFIADPADLDVYGSDVPAWARRLAAACWPGALTLVVRASVAVPPEYAQPGANGGPATIALRVPGSALCRQLVRAAGAPLAQTSANTHGAPAATSGHGVESAIVAAADLTLDAGPAPVGVASTIVDATGPVPRILRIGALSEATVLLAAHN